jgi:hypothetical protein
VNKPALLATLATALSSAAADPLRLRADALATAASPAGLLVLESDGTAARASLGTLRAESTVMSGTPVLSTLREGLAGASPIAVRGVLNATANYVVSEMARGQTYADALAAAQRLRPQGRVAQVIAARERRRQVGVDGGRAVARRGRQRESLRRRGGLVVAVGLGGDDRAVRPRRPSSIWPVTFPRLIISDLNLTGMDGV